MSAAAAGGGHDQGQDHGQDLDLGQDQKITLAEIDEDLHGAEIKAITADEKVMKWVGNGQTWSEDKLRKFFDYCAAEQRDEAARTYYYYAVMLGKVCIGVVGVHPVGYVYSDPVLTVFMSSATNSRGYGTRAIELAFEKYWSHFPEAAICVDVRSDNFAMLRVADKLKLFRGEGPKIRGRPYRRFEAVRGGGFERR